MLHAEGKPIRMTALHRTFLGLVLALTVIPGWQLLATLPQPGVAMDQVIPAEARPGTVVTINGYGLDREHIQEIYLMSEDNQAYPVEILAASGDRLRFKVPERIPAGLMEIAIKAPDKAGVIDQMLFLKVLEPAG